VTSELTRQGERARYARDIEKANIDAWKERQIAMYNANATMAAGLGAATMAAFAPPSASALSSTLSAAMQPFSNIGVRRGYPIQCLSAPAAGAAGAARWSWSPGRSSAWMFAAAGGWAPLS
jgi:hypothetical protein